MATTRRKAAKRERIFWKMLASIPFKILTFAYYVRLRNTTLEPLRLIMACRGNFSLAQTRMAKFMTIKRLELHHVRVASTISAAATIGVFSWPDAATTFWPARALWFISMILSFFSLIASQLDRLLDAVPCMDGGKAVTPAEVEHAYQLITWTPWETEANSAAHELQKLVIIYFWQSPVMQMSWSWMTFLMGLTLHIIKTFIPHSGDESERKVAITFLAVIGFAVANFLSTGIILHNILSDAEMDDTFMMPDEKTILPLSDVARIATDKTIVAVDVEEGH